MDPTLIRNKSTSITQDITLICGKYFIDLNENIHNR